MHYYKRNIGEYAKRAARLTMIQHGAYTLLIDSCYDREEFPTLNDAIDWCWASTDEERAAVEFVLGKFFSLESGVYVQNRIAEELFIYHENAKTNKRIAIKRESNRREKSTERAHSVNDSSTNEHEAPPNQEPRTKNHKPRTINQELLTISKDDTKKSTRFTPPTIEEITNYCKERKNGIDANKFFNYYESNGWKRGNTKIKCWEACIRTWESRESPNQPAKPSIRPDAISKLREQVSHGPE